MESSVGSQDVYHKILREPAAAFMFKMQITSEFASLTAQESKGTTYK